MCEVFHSSLRIRATGILSCSRYFATVRRAILYPFSLRRSISFSSVSGLCLSSAAMASDKIFLTSLVETSSPLSVDKDSEKKKIISKENYQIGK